MSQLRSDILKKRKREEIEKFEQQYKRVHITAPIQPNNDEEERDSFLIDISDDEDEEIDTSIFNENDDNNNASEIFNVDNWLQVVENWIKMLDIENHLDNGEDINEEPLEFELGGRIIHPADDPLAKWNLLDLFNDSLDAPIYLSSLTNY
jgi:hypothetical protein